MDNLRAAAVQVDQGIEELVSPGQDIVNRQTGVAGRHALLKVVARDKLHDQQLLIIDGQIALNLRQGWMAEAGQDLGLTREGAADLRKTIVLDRDVMTIASIDGLIDSAHATAANQADNLVLVSKQGTGGKDAHLFTYRQS